MIKIDLAATLANLNKVSRYALEEASAYSVEKNATEVTVSHILIKILENPFSDIRVILDQADIDIEEFKQSLVNIYDSSDMNVGGVPSFSPLLIEVFQEAWLLSSLEYQQHSIRTGTIFIAILANVARYLPLQSINLLSTLNCERLRKDFISLAKSSSENETVGGTQNQSSLVQSGADSPLERFGNNITEQAVAGDIDPVLARDKEIDLMIDILSRRRKNNPIVVGDAGVGKSALIEGLALRITQKRVPKHLQSVQLWTLDLGALQSGASIKGEFEKRLKSIIDYIINSDENIILFIDEAHTLIGAGGEVGGSDAANLLKPALARGQLRTIAATTWSEYKKYFEKDPALSRRFQLVKLDEPTVDEAVTILRGLKSIYEQSHGVYITGDALRAVASLSDRYVSGKKLPDKAIDILDTACARVATAKDSTPNRINYLDNKCYEIEQEISEIQRDNSLGEEIDEKYLLNLNDQLAILKEQKEELTKNFNYQKGLVDEILSLRNDISNEELSDEDKTEIGKKLSEIKATYENIRGEDKLLYAEVGIKQITAVISDLTGVPASTITSDELGKVTQLPNLLNQLVKGQEQAITKIHQSLLTSTADLRREGTPLGAFLLVGPSGVGKTETAIQIAEHLFGGRQFLTTINMSEYQEKHTVSRLIGSPPGYVGYGEGGLLTEAIRQKPYSIVLLDEVEKAHPDVLNLFYQAFDKGELADGEGRQINCGNILFILTSNIGFDDANDTFELKSDEALRAMLLKFFKPALLARMQVIQYAYLSSDVLENIVQAKLDKLVKLFEKRYGAELCFSDDVIESVKTQCTIDANGARMLDAILENQLLPPLSLAVLQKMAENGKIIKAIVQFEDDYIVTLS
ncbi:MAG: type VI secretion system ATPase TssH [Gammaproteobacteria bacterium]|nr:type VI secretion system ATPase TssH [Gammaproteobacteria bacterium]